MNGPEHATDPAAHAATLATRKLEIEADPDFLTRHNNPARNAALVKQWNDVFKELNPEPPPGVDASTEATTAPEGVTEPAPTPLIPLPAVPEGHPGWNVPTVNTYVTSVGALGMAPEEAGRWVQYTVDQFSKAPPDPVTTLATLREEWGGDFDRNLLAAQLAAQRLPAYVRVLLNQTALGEDPALIRRMATLGAKFVEPWQRGQARKKEIEADKDFTLERNSPRHAALVAEWNRIFKELHPEME